MTTRRRRASCRMAVATGLLACLAACTKKVPEEKIPMQAGPLKFALPVTYELLAGAEGPRRGEWMIPPAGTGGEGRIVVYDFGREGADIEASLQRFTNQFRQDPPGNARTSRMRMPGRPNMTVLEVRGTWLGDERMRQQGVAELPEHEMKVACVHLKKGEIYVVIVAPRATLTARTDEVHSLLGSLHDAN